MFSKRNTITVKVKPYSIVRDYVKEGDFEVREGTRLRKVLKRAGALGHGFNLICMVNGERVRPSHPLSDDDEIKLMVVVGGG